MSKKDDLLDISLQPSFFVSKKKPGAFKKAILKQLGKKCNRCGSTKNLTLHHINQCTSDNRIENFEVLCRVCHDLHHYGRVTPDAWMGGDKECGVGELK